jgi:P pilus assembly chaperone PapD
MARKRGDREVAPVRRAISPRFGRVKAAGSNRVRVVLSGEYPARQTDKTLFFICLLFDQEEI